jgi:hypothetical protein
MSGGITLVDTLAPRAYSGAPGQLTGLGGTEATLVRISESLACRFRVTLRQSARQGPDALSGGVRYGGFDVKGPLPEAPGTIVVVNSWKVALRLARLHPMARVIVWQHVFPGRHNRALAPALRAARVEILCVSAAHADWMRGFLGAEAPAVGTIHNPIADDLHPDDTPRNRDLLLFASSPHKGLGQVFRRYEALKDRVPSLRLLLADPGYLAWPTGPVPDGVIPLGRLEQPELIRWMRRALCLFYPQDQFAETFGLVIARPMRSAARRSFSAASVRMTRSPLIPASASTPATPTPSPPGSSTGAAKSGGALSPPHGRSFGCPEWPANGRPFCRPRQPARPNSTQCKTQLERTDHEGRQRYPQRHRR